MVALNALWNTGLPPDELASLGRSLGADVPVFVRGRAAWAEGVGERLTPMTLDEPWFLVVTPSVQVSTAEIFSAPDLKRDCAPVTEADFQAGRCGNVCEAVTFARYPVVREVFTQLSRFGTARMSGTGASCFVAFVHEAAAREAAQSLPASWPHFVARGLNHSPLFASV